MSFAYRNKILDNKEIFLNWGYEQVAPDENWSERFLGVGGREGGCTWTVTDTEDAPV